MIAVPFMEIFDNPLQFGPLIASIPHLLSRYDLIPTASLQVTSVQANEEHGDESEVVGEAEVTETTGINAEEVESS